MCLLFPYFLVLCLQICLFLLISLMVLLISGIKNGVILNTLSVCSYSLLKKPYTHFNKYGY